MAQLTGVVVQSGREIEYEGVRYVQTEGQAQLGDIVRCDNSSSLADVSEGEHYLVEVNEGDVVGFLDDVGDSEGLNGELDYNIGYLSDKFTVFCRVEPAPQSPTEIRTLIESKRAELAELEAQLSEMETIGINDYARLTRRSYGGGPNGGEIVRVTHIDDSDVPYKFRLIIGDTPGWAYKDGVVKISASEAKAALLAQVEEAFESAE
ncbi:hypothetical protein D3C78_1289790 [compost metagenome]